MNKRIRVLAFLTVALLLLAQLASAAPPQGADKAYLVGFREGASARSLSVAGVRVEKEWSHLNAALVRANAAGLSRLQGHGAVEYVEEDRPVYALGHGSLPYQNGGDTWGLQAVHAREAWNMGATGQGIRVCVLDTGIDYNHPEFIRDGTSIIKGSKNFVNDGHATAQDGHGHGTHVAGTVAGQSNQSGSYIGVAPGADLYVARVLGDDGSGTTSGVLDGLDWCLNQAKAHVANLSLGSSFGSRTEDRAYKNAYSKGMLIVAASGNDGSRKISYPAKYSSVIAVGALDQNLGLASFSNFGREQELVAPGVAVLSSVPVGTGAKTTASEDNTAYPSNGVEYSGTGNVTGPLVECGLADSTSSCTNKPSSGSWIALISRGSITFADKVTNVMAQGAAAAIITNNDTANPDDAGAFTLGSAGDWIPTVSVSYNSGEAIRSGGLGTGNVAVEPWDYAAWDGTSMASPHAAGVAALAWSANPALSNVKIREILGATAKDLGKAGKDTTYGYGLVQADAAVAAAQAN